MLHSAQPNTAHAAAGNNPPSAPDPFPHPPGINPLPPRNGPPRSPLPRTRGNHPPLESSGAHPSGNQPDMRRPRCFKQGPLSSHAGINPPAPGRIRTELTPAPAARRSTKGHVADPTPATAHPRTHGDQPFTARQRPLRRPIPANAGINPKRPPEWRVYSPHPRKRGDQPWQALSDSEATAHPPHAGINPAGDAARNGSIPRTRRGSTRVDVV